MHNFNFNLLKNLLEIPSYSGDCTAMQCYIIDYAKKKGWDIVDDEVGNLYIVKGESETFPCVVAHLDTVHRILPGGIQAVMVGSNIITGINPWSMKQTGIGGDDKCGVFAALEILNILPKCKVALFVDEEVGCVGSSKCRMDFFNDCRFVLQTDRRGNSDFVTDICGPLSSDEFQDDVFSYLQKYGFRHADGMMTDVQALRDRGVGISSANISSGYYNPHQDNEYIRIDDLKNTLNLMLDICMNMTNVYKFEYEDRYSMSSYYGHGWSSSHSSNKGGKKEWTDEDFDLKWQQKYGIIPDDEEEPTIDRVDFQHKSISEMTDAEWLEFQLDVDDTIDDETFRLQEWLRDNSEHIKSILTH